MKVMPKINQIVEGMSKEETTALVSSFLMCYLDECDGGAMSLCDVWDGDKDAALQKKVDKLSREYVKWCNEDGEA